jgi:hypothetical protein
MPEPRNRVVQVRRFGGPDGLEVIDAPWPTPGRGEVRVRVLASSFEPRGGLHGGPATRYQCAVHDRDGQFDALCRARMISRVGRRERHDRHDFYMRTSPARQNS